MPQLEDLQTRIDSLWESRNEPSLDSKHARNAVAQTLALLDSGELRAAEKRDGTWIAHAWVKKALLLSFLLSPMKRIEGAPDGTCWWDKIDNKFSDWQESDFREGGFRTVPSCVVRRSAYIGRGAVLMPCFVNVGAYIGENTMIDTWSTVGSCAQIGRNVHISGGAGIGGVLEPLQARPVIIEDNCFIGARAEIAEGVLVEEGAVIAMGVFLGQSTRIVERNSGKIHYGRVPARSVVVPGTMPATTPFLPNGKPAPALACAVIVKTVDQKTREKTAINTILRDAVRDS